MLDEKLDSHLSEIKKAIEQSKSAHRRVERLEKENSDLREKIGEVHELQEQIQNLKDKVSASRKTKKTLTRIESLESEVENLKSVILAREGSILNIQRIRDDEKSEVDEVKVFMGHIDYIAKKLGIKAGNRTFRELIGAVEDRIRKIAG